jgi:hypothetical protein
MSKISWEPNTPAIAVMLGLILVLASPTSGPLIWLEGLGVLLITCSAPVLMLAPKKK